MSIQVNVPPGVLLVGGGVLAAALFTGQAVPIAARSFAPLVEDAGNKLHAARYRMAGFIESKKKSWKRFFGRGQADLHEERWAVLIQAAICYDQIMIVNSGLIGVNKPVIEHLWCPCVVPPELAADVIFKRVEECINETYRNDVGTGRASKLCNAFKYNETCGMIVFYLKTAEDCRFVHMAPEEEIGDYVLLDNTGQKLDANGGGAYINGNISKCALATIQWKDRRERLGRGILQYAPVGGNLPLTTAQLRGLYHPVIPDKLFFSIPLSSSLMQLPDNPGTDFAGSIQSILHHLGCAQAYMQKKQEMPPTFSEYCATYNIRSTTLHNTDAAIQAYFLNKIVPLLSETWSSCTLDGSNLVHWSNQVFPNITIYRKEEFAYPADASENPNDANREPVGDLMARMFNSQYRIAVV